MKISTLVTNTKGFFLLLFGYFLAVFLAGKITAVWITEKVSFIDFASAGFVDAVLVFAFYYLLNQYVLKQDISSLNLSLRRMGKYACVAIFMLALPTSMLFLFGYYVVVDNQSWAFVPLILVTLFLQGLSNEVLFRGIFFQNMKTWVGPKKALIILCTVYAGLNLLIDGLSLQAFTIHWLFCCLMCLIYMRTGNLWVTGTFHGCWLFISFLPGVLDEHWRDGAPWITEVTGSSIMSGGQLGAEASLISLVILSAATIYLYRLNTSASVAPS